jgi:hypothetical protein
MPNWPMMNGFATWPLIFCPLAFHFTVRGLSAEVPGIPPNPVAVHYSS